MKLSEPIKNSCIPTKLSPNYRPLGLPIVLSSFPVMIDEKI